MFLDKSSAIKKGTVLYTYDRRRLHTSGNVKQCHYHTSSQEKDPNKAPYRKDSSLNHENSRANVRNSANKVKLPGVKVRKVAGEAGFTVKQNGPGMKTAPLVTFETFDELKNRYKKSAAETRRLKKSVKMREKMQKKSQQVAGSTQREIQAPLKPRMLVELETFQTPERRRTGFMDVDSNEMVRPDRGSEKVNKKKNRLRRDKITRKPQPGMLGAFARRAFPFCFREIETSPPRCRPL